MTPLASAGSRAAILLAATALLAGSAAQLRGTSARAVAPSSSATTPSTAAPSTTAARPKAHPTPAVPAALTRVGLGLRAGAVAVPLELRIPSIGVHAPMVGVGITAKNVMDAPEGRFGDPVWQQAFWYRGSAVPGAISTALIAGHIDGPRGSSAVFGQIEKLHKGDLIVVHDTRTGLDVRFSVTGSESYSLAQTTEKSVLVRMYGAGPVAGTGPQRSADGLAHLAIVTCAGTFDYGLGTHDHRLAVFATRIA
jgi:hypothetical protein